MMEITVFRAIILGAVQGLTELLPYQVLHIYS